ncbi:Rho guanine nucleotide exchange factor 16 [Galemys pyrenaicus]|uniref:Rho guanine nucleotide exchange factor 16 n=1 Tax=Galemys pyrenaicus TaxID=202257 RepID=A0A8J5ZFM4_GALPY|nr:Rho guanine nucleotide exchange factor 16 [Galemys pyrenaicus]
MRPEWPPQDVRPLGTRLPCGASWSAERPRWGPVRLTWRPGRALASGARLLLASGSRGDRPGLREAGRWGPVGEAAAPLRPGRPGQGAALRLWEERKTPTELELWTALSAEPAGRAGLDRRAAGNVPRNAAATLPVRGRPAPGSPDQPTPEAADEGRCAGAADKGRCAGAAALRHPGPGGVPWTGARDQGHPGHGGQAGPSPRDLDGWWHRGACGLATSAAGPNRRLPPGDRGPDPRPQPCLVLLPGRAAVGRGALSAGAEGQSLCVLRRAGAAGTSAAPPRRTGRGMSQRHSDSSLETKLLESRFHSELGLDAEQCPASGFPMVRRAPRARDGASPPASLPASPEGEAPRPVVLSTQSAAALKMGTQQLIPRSLAVSSKAKAPARHQSFGAAVLSKEAARRGPRLASTPSFSLDDMDVDTGSGGALKRNLRNQSYRAAMKGLVPPGGEGSPARLTPKLQALAEEPSQPPARCPAKNKRTLARKRAHKGSFKDDPRFYQEVRERGLNTSHDSDDDLLDEPPSPDGTQKAEAPIVVRNFRPPQVTWSQLPEVLESGLLDTLPAEERKRQETIFEILTSEFSYQHSLGTLVAEFLQSPELRATMTHTEHHHLFSNILDVQGASQRFFEDLERRHKEQVCVEDIGDLLAEHAEHHFQPYVVYCSNEVYQQRTLQRLQNSNSAFREALRAIETRPACGGLPMISFLILPMQRVTRLPLLTDTLCVKSQSHPQRYSSACRAFKAISKVRRRPGGWRSCCPQPVLLTGKQAHGESSRSQRAGTVGTTGPACPCAWQLVKKCNEGAHQMQRTEQMYTLHTQLDFSKVKSLPLISASRWLLKRGELSLAEETGRFRKLAGRPACYLFLFNDFLVVTRKKSEDSFVVQDYAQADAVQVQKVEPSECAPPGGGQRGPSVPHAFRLTLLRNSEGRREGLLLSCDAASDRARWVMALSHGQRQGPANKEDLLQVEATKAYLAKQEDELALQQADVVLVLEQEDGWLYGERLRDGETGWFPGDVARSITSRLALEGNVRRRERLRLETDV